jgi:hypothetical protein
MPLLFDLTNLSKIYAWLYRISNTNALTNGDSEGVSEGALCAFGPFRHPLRDTISKRGCHTSIASSTQKTKSGFALFTI